MIHLRAKLRLNIWTSPPRASLVLTTLNCQVTPRGNCQSAILIKNVSSVAVSR
ncbi:hypothetical protein Hamer_G029332, partial [Homarus americanus]